jgi:hypothetical protein
MTMKLRNWMKRALLAAIASSAAVSSLAQAITDNGTLTIGHVVYATACGWADLIFSGYASGGTTPFGSYSPTGLTGGTVVSAIMNYGCFFPTVAAVSVTGFATNPGQLWLASITCNGITKTGASAVSYSYSGGKAQWNWNDSFGFGHKPAGSNVSCSIVH